MTTRSAPEMRPDSYTDRTQTGNEERGRMAHTPRSHRRIGRDSNSRYAFTYTHFPDRETERRERAARVESPRISDRLRVAARHSNDCGCAPRRTQTVHGAHDSSQFSPEEKALAHRAHGAVARAVARGDLVRPERCTRCPAPGPVQAHHFMGYEREHWLDVLWLCRGCHTFARRRGTIADRIRVSRRARLTRAQRQRAGGSL